MWKQITSIASQTTGRNGGNAAFSRSLSSSSSVKNNVAYIKPLALIASTATLATILKSSNMNSIVSGIYDSLIVDMTEKWYRAVLSKLEDGSTVLDVGIGTAGALLRCSDLVESKNLKIIGIDYNAFYIQSAKESIKEVNLSDRITVYELDLYNEEKVRALLKESSVDAVYFSGSFSLLPNPDGALTSILSLLKKDGKVYITQTYQKRSPPFLGLVKPLIKYLTTIDFGRLIKVDEIAEFFDANKDFCLESHDVIEGSVDTYFQAAYLSILMPQNRKGL